MIYSVTQSTFKRQSRMAELSEIQSRVWTVFFNVDCDTDLQSANQWHSLQYRDKSCIAKSPVAKSRLGTGCTENLWLVLISRIVEGVVFQTVLYIERWLILKCVHC